MPSWALCMYQNCFSNCPHGYLFWSFFFRLSPMQGLIWKQRKSEQSAISVWWYIKSAGEITRGVRATMLRQMKIFNARKNVAVNLNMWQITIEENDSLDQYSHKKNYIMHHGITSHWLRRSSKTVTFSRYLRRGLS